MNPIKQTGTSIHVLNGEWYNEQCILLFLFIYLSLLLLLLLLFLHILLSIPPMKIQSHE